MQRRLAFLLLLVSVSGIISSCGLGGLPQEARAALDDYIRRGYGGSSKGYQGEYNIASAQKAGRPDNAAFYFGDSQRDEIWCVVLDRPVTVFLSAHYLVARRGLAWDVVQVRESQWDAREWLEMECTNY